MKNSSQLITFFLSLFPPCYEMGRFACCAIEDEQAGFVTTSVAPCSRRALQHRVIALTLKLTFFISIHL